jgi:endonuclease/exonuclease/phosphatase family metal-dependent hydrolase
MNQDFLHPIRWRATSAFQGLLLGLVLALGCSTDAQALQATPSVKPTTSDHRDDDLRVMSFNIRFGTANDGANHWNVRQEFLVETIREFRPDLLGTQETLGFQRDYLAKHLEGYDHLGVGRDDGKEAGEMMAIYWKRERFEKLDSGHFWLSETPETVASKSWDTSLPRMVTWVKLKDRRQPAALPILWYNTHFDHRGEQARLESAKLIRQRALASAADALLVVTGDFNAGEASPPYAALFAPVEPGQPQIIDTYRHVHSQRSDQEGTFSGFDATATSGARIDWIAVCDRWQIISAAIDRTQKDGRSPSDHFPVTAVLRVK